MSNSVTIATDAIKQSKIMVAKQLLLGNGGKYESIPKHSHHFAHHDA